MVLCALREGPVGGMGGWGGVGSIGRVRGGCGEIETEHKRWGGGGLPPLKGFPFSVLSLGPVAFLSHGQ